MIKIIYFLALFSSFLLAQPTQAQALSMVQSNPALLNTPQAKAVMAEKGISLSDVQNKLASQTDATTVTEVEATNVIAEENTGENFTGSKKVQRLSSVKLYQNPFVFQSNQKIIDTLRAKQQREEIKKLSRYSNRFFANKNTIDATSLPTPKSYVITNGDSIRIHIYGDRDKEEIVKVKNDGTIEFPFLGPIKVGGMKFGDAKEFLEKKLQAHYKLSYFNVSMQKYSTIQVTLIGDVNYPGLYNLSSFATVKDLLITAKGVRPTASLRKIIIKRDAKVIASVDMYDLFFNGDDLNNKLLEQGDIVIVKKAKQLVSIDGYVNHGAIYELKKGQTLDDLIRYAGGLKPSASKVNIKVSRYINHSKKESYKLSYKNAKKFKMQDGDSVYIYPLDFVAKVSANLYGNIIRPGAYNISNSKTLYWFFKHNIKKDLKSFFLPNTYFEYGMIKRYSDNLTYTTLSFNLSKVLKGTQIIRLKPNDEIYIFSKNDIFSNSYITTKGAALLKAGKLQFIDGITIQDAINASGIKGVLDDKVRVTTFTTDDFMPKTTFYSLKKQGDTKLNPYDEIEVYDYYTSHQLKPVSIGGEVVNPTTVYYEKGMSVADLVKIAGGLSSVAYTENLEIVRYSIDENQTRHRKVKQYNLQDKKLSSIKLQPYDEVKIFKIPQWGEKSYITLQGEFVFPGRYSIEKGEKLSSVIQRAGGFTSTAFVNGAVFTRESIRKSQIEQYNKTLSRLKRSFAVYNAMPANAKQAVANTTDTLNEVIKESKKYQPLGRVSISIDENMSRFEQSSSNIVLQNGDSLTVPTAIDTVTVFGEVFNPSSFIYKEDLDADDYIKLASGFSRTADKDSIYVIHADGMSEPIYGGWFSADATIHKGDTIVVPIYIKEQNQLDVWNSIAKIFSSFALTAAAVNTLGVF